MLLTVLIALTLVPSYAYAGFNRYQTNEVRIAFTAFNTRQLRVGGNGIVCLDGTIINEGGAYDPSTGIFTAPRDGIYKFEWTFLTRDGQLFVSSLMRDGKVVAYNHAGDHRSKNWDSATQSVFLSLRQGNKIWIQARGNDGRYLHGNRYSTFSGQLI